MEKLWLVGIVILLTACFSADNRFGDRIEEASFILERHEDALLSPGGMSYQELFDLGQRDLMLLDSISSSIEREQREQSDEAGESAVRYLRAARQFIRASNDLQRSLLNMEIAEQAGPPGNELALALHSKDENRIRRAQARASAYAKELQDALDDVEASQSALDDAHIALLSARKKLAEFIPATRLVREDFAYHSNG